MAHPGSAFPIVQLLVSEGLSDYRIATRTGIPRATVQRRRHRTSAPGTHEPTRWAVTDRARYLTVSERDGVAILDTLVGPKT